MDTEPPSPEQLPQQPSREPSAPAPRPLWRRGLWHAFSQFWTGTVDARPLGLMRITFAAVVLISVLDTGPVLIDFLSDEGTMPRSALFDGVARLYRFSLMDACGLNWQTWVYWAACLAAAACLMIGWRTRIACAATFFLVSGMHERNVLAFDGADSVIRVVLFWLMFTESGRCYSLDAVLCKTPRPREVPAFAVRLVQLQIAWVYLDTFLYKLTGSMWASGTALHYAMQLEHLFTRRTGVWLATWVWLTRFGTFAAMVIEGAFAPLMFLPVGQPRLRAAGLFLGAGLHAGIAFTMNVGNFSLLMPACYPIFFAPAWAERVIGAAARLARRWSPRVTDRLTAWLAARSPPAPAVWTLPWPLPWALCIAAGRVLLLVSLMLACWFSFPKGLTPLVPPAPQRVRETIDQLELWQSWDMFSPNPMNTDFYLRGDGKRVNGEDVDVLHGLRGGPLPRPGVGVFYTRWTKMISHLAYGSRDRLLPFGRYLCRVWNDDLPRGQNLATFRLVRVERRNADPGQPAGEWRDVEIWNHRCF